MSLREVDVVVIGAGPVGENVADRTAQAGLETVIVESELVGGECSYWACMPSKTLLRPAAAFEAARATPGAAGAVTGTLDVAAALAWRDEMTHDWSDDSQVEWLRGAGIELVRGTGRLSAEHEATVRATDGTESTLRARVAVAVCTGTAALLPDIPGLAGAEPWTSREATSVQNPPESLVIVGGGVVACEMATAFASFGTRVTMIARSPLLGKMEPFAGDAVTRALRASGVVVHIGAEPTSVARADGAVTVQLSDGTSVVGEELLVATGRVPRTMDLGVDLVGAEPGDYLDVDDTLLVRGTDWLYAVGDVNGRVLLTHQGKYQARAAGDVIAARAAGTDLDDEPWGAHVATADHSAVPQVVFTLPEVASVGATVKGAHADGRRVRVLDYDLGWVAGASVEAEEYSGYARAVVDEDRGVLVGATFVGPNVAELLHAATIAIVGEVPVHRLWHAVPSYPTVSEVWLRWLEEYGRQSAVTS